MTLPGPLAPCLYLSHFLGQYRARSSPAAVGHPDACSRYFGGVSSAQIGPRSRRRPMAAEMVAPAWMHEQITAEEYATWTQEQCAGIEIVDGMVLASPNASKRHNRLARI